MSEIFRFLSGHFYLIFLSGVTLISYFIYPFVYLDFSPRLHCPFVLFYFQIATNEKESILSSMPDELREKGSVLHASLTEGKVLHTKEKKFFKIEHEK